MNNLKITNDIELQNSEINMLNDAVACSTYSRAALLLFAVWTVAPRGLTVSPHLQGFFLDVKHHVPGSWKGVRILSDANGDSPGSALTLVGTDDGETFWVLEGKRMGADGVQLDFSPKGGPPDLLASWSEAEGALTFSDGNIWLRVDARFAPDGPDFGPRLVEEPSVGGALQGIFADKVSLERGRALDLAIPLPPMPPTASLPYLELMPSILVGPLPHLECMPPTPPRTSPLPPGTSPLSRAHAFDPRCTFSPYRLRSPSSRWAESAWRSHRRRSHRRPSWLPPYPRPKPKLKPSPQFKRASGEQQRG